MRFHGPVQSSLVLSRSNLNNRFAAMADVATAMLDAVSRKHPINPHPAKIFEHITHFGSNV